MQIPPIKSMSKASTVAKIGRPMKKLTMAASYLAFFSVGAGDRSIGLGFGIRSGSSWTRARPSSVRAQPSWPRLLSRRWLSMSGKSRDPAVEARVGVEGRRGGRAGTAPAGPRPA